MDAAGVPCALGDDNRESDDENPAREHRAPSAADRVEHGDEKTDRDDGRGALREGVRVDEHPNPQHHSDNGEERPGDNPQSARSTSEIGTRQVRWREPAGNQSRSQRTPRRAMPAAMRASDMVVSIMGSITPGSGRSLDRNTRAQFNSCVVNFGV